MSKTTDCYARIESDAFIIGNPLIERRFRIERGRLLAVGLLDKTTGRDWIVQPASIASLCASPVETDQSPQLSITRTHQHMVEAESFCAELSVATQSHNLRYQFKLFGDLPAIGMRLSIDSPIGAAGADQVAAADAPSGVESDAPAAQNVVDPSDIIDHFHFDYIHCWLTETRFVEQTDIHNNLVFENRWSLGHSEKQIHLAGNVFYLEHRPSSAGMVMLKESPSPQYRPVACQADLDLRLDQLTLRGHGLDQSGGAGYRQWIVLYNGDETKRIGAIQSLQQRIRPYIEGRDGVLLSNTWGDRSRDAAISEAFMLREVAAGAAMGVDVAQIDDGWQKGLTANSATKGGVWNGFWASDEQFWAPHPTRFPNSLDPLVQSLEKNRMQLGLWYAPDSSNNVANWERDAKQVLELYARHGVRHVKIDAVKMHSKLAERRLEQFYNRVLAKSHGQVTFDPDVTAEVRPGYWGQMHVGTTFVENRYTDWHSYWPHLTLRNLWSLAHHIHPMRLRMEFLNNTRNDDKYPNDPLAPSRYSPAALFAMVMMSSPLAWFEISNAPSDYRHEVADLIRIWKRHRAQIFTSIILPIGDEPDGYHWSGFVTSRTAGDLYAVVYRPLGEQSGFDFALPRAGARSIEVLHGQAKASIENDRAVLFVDRPLEYAFIRIAF
jgi:alpha-galactosidase